MLRGVTIFFRPARVALGTVRAVRRQFQVGTPSLLRVLTVLAFVCAWCGLSPRSALAQIAVDVPLTDGGATGPDTGDAGATPAASAVEQVVTPPLAAGNAGAAVTLAINVEPQESKPRTGPFPVEVKITPSAIKPYIEPWSDNDPGAGPSRLSFGDFGIRMNAEYRAVATAITPVSLGQDYNKKMSWFEHRLRVDAMADYKDVVRVVTSVDALEGVLWGDNGSFGGTPAATSGLNANVINVNSTRLCTVNYDPSRPAEPTAYRTGLCDAAPIFMRRLYGELLTPIGLLRVGRQPFTLGAGVAVNDGDGRRNRFGISYRGNTADRILFATKPLEGFKTAGRRNKSESEGLFLILTYDKLVQDEPQKFKDDAQEFNTALRWLVPEHKKVRDVEARFTHTHRWDRLYGTTIDAFGGRFMAKMGDFSAGIDGAVVTGKTREVSEAFRLINNDPVSSQTIKQLGARAVVRYDRKYFTAYLEGDYASGDSDPKPRSALTQYKFAEDSNVGLLLFEHVLAYQTARTAAAATALFQSLGSPTIPVDAIATRGSFTNAVAFFPQFDIRPIKNVMFRGGVLLAWAPSKVNDPIASQQRKDGQLENFVGGKPGQFYGTELDARIQWRFVEHFAFDLEGAILFPGSALQNLDGYATRSVFVQGRTTFFF